MLNPFPDLLIYSFFAPTLLRVLIGAVFLWSAYVQYQRRHELARVRFPVVGSGSWIISFSVLVHAAIGAGLILGYYTQIAALLGALGALKGLVWAKKYPRVFPLCRIDYFFILAVCLSLLISGAGAFAFDLPL